MINLPKFLIFGLPVVVGLLLAGAGFFLFRDQMPGGISKPDKVTLTYWSLLESRDVLQPLIEQYEAENPHVTIDYNLQSYSTFAQYKETLYTRLQQGSGPDMARMHATWPHQFYKYLEPAPTSVVPPQSLAETFYSPAVEACQVNGSVYALPLMYDGLVLIYNKDLFKDSAISAPPETWKEFRDIAVKLSNWKDNDPNNELLQSGAALGNASNVSHTTDVLGLMLEQSEVSIPSQLDSQAAQDVFTFYTNFVKKDKVWNDTWTQDISAFKSGKVGMLIAPYWQVVRLREANPAFEIGVSPVPQVPTLEGELTDIGWANFWVDGVSANTAHPQEAWKFLKYLSEKQSQETWLQRAQELKGFTFASARKDLEDRAAGTELEPVLRWAPHSGISVISTCAGNTDYERAVNAAVEEIISVGSPESILANLKETLTVLVDGNSLGLQEEPLECSLASFGSELPDVEEEPSPTSEPTPTATAAPTAAPLALSCESLEVDTDSGEAPLEVTFTVSVSDDELVSQYHFDFGDGSTKESSSVRVVHIYEEAGTYTASVRLEDETGELTAENESCQVSISVEDSVEPTAVPTTTPTATPTATPVDTDLDTGGTIPSIIIMGVGMLIVAFGLLY